MKFFNSNNAKISLKKMRTIFILSTCFTAFFIDQERVGVEISQILNSKTLKPRAEDWLLYGRTYGRLEKLWLLRGGFDSLLLRLSGGDDGGTAGFL